MMNILILEDNQDRQAAMRDCLGDRFSQYEHVFFDDAGEMCAYLQAHLSETLFISLDHDLEMKPGGNGTMHDPGTGRMVADFLAGLPPTCPVVIATTNSSAGDGMEFRLRESGWCVNRVFPFGHMEWIPTTWFRAMRNAIVGAARPAVSASHD